MIRSATLPIPGVRVLKPGREVVRLTDQLREDAAREVEAALDGASGKRIRAAGVPGAGLTYLSRIRHGDDGNPLFRLASLFVLGRMLGIPKERFQRLLDWLQTKLDEAYADAPEPSLDTVLETDSVLDPIDDRDRFLAARGCPAAARRLLENKRRQFAHLRGMIRALSSNVRG